MQRKKFEFFAGIDGVAPIINGVRKVQHVTSQHDKFWKVDFLNVKRLGMNCLRWGPNWFEVNPEPEKFDWSTVDEKMLYAQELGLEIWYVLQHKQLPDWIADIHDTGIAEALGRYGEEVIKRYPHLNIVVPQVEPAFYCVAACDWGLWHPHQRDIGMTLSAGRNLAAAACEASERIKRLKPEVKIMLVEHTNGTWYCKDTLGYIDIYGLDYYAWAHHEHDLVGWAEKWWDELKGHELSIGEIDYAGGYCNHDINFQANFLKACFNDCKAIISSGINLTSMSWYPTVTENMYWGTCLTEEYDCRYGKNSEFIGDNTGSFFRFKIDDGGILKRVASPTMIKTFKREERRFREWENLNARE